MRRPATLWCIDSHPFAFHNLRPASIPTAKCYGQPNHTFFCNPAVAKLKRYSGENNVWRWLQNLTQQKFVHDLLSLPLAIKCLTINSSTVHLSFCNWKRLNLINNDWLIDCCKPYVSFYHRQSTSFINSAISPIKLCRSTLSSSHEECDAIGGGNTRPTATVINEWRCDNTNVWL